MQTEDMILRQAVEDANKNIYASDSIKGYISNNNDLFKVSIFSNKCIYNFKIMCYEKSKNIKILFQAKHNFIKNLITNNIDSLNVCLDNEKINSFANIKNSIQYKISLFKDNIYNIEIEISEN